MPGGAQARANRFRRGVVGSLDRAEPAARREKLYGFLARQGYAAETVRKVMRRVLDVSPSDD